METAIFSRGLAMKIRSQAVEGRKEKRIEDRYFFMKWEIKGR